MQGTALPAEPAYGRLAVSRGLLFQLWWSRTPSFSSVAALCVSVWRGDKGRTLLLWRAKRWHRITEDTRCNALASTGQQPHSKTEPPAMPKCATIADGVPARLFRCLQENAYTCEARQAAVPGPPVRPRQACAPTACLTHAPTPHTLCNGGSRGAATTAAAAARTAR